jgi:hypothetical protein
MKKTPKPDKPVLFPWACPKCGAIDGHGKGGAEKCNEHGSLPCQGLICECWENGEKEAAASEKDDHGQTLTNPCTNAVCYHCGWGGTVPQKPKGLQAWEKKALEAGWVPPEGRCKELGL